MKHFSVKPMLVLSLLISLFSFNACQKDGLEMADTGVQSSTNVHAGDRAPSMYGITVYSPGKPSRLIELDVASGVVLNNIPVFAINDFGQQIALNDLKGVCFVNADVYITTGSSNTAAFNNSLFKVNTATGQADIVSTSNIGIVSDIDYDAVTDRIYGLLNNTNTLVRISNAFTTYTNVGAINNLGAGFVSKGLTMVRAGSTGGGGDRVVVAASSNAGAQLYEVPGNAGFATLLTNVNPANEMAKGHCGIGYQISTAAMLINRTGSVPVAGLNTFLWNNAVPAQSNSTLWSSGFNYEDLTSVSQ